MILDLFELPALEILRDSLGSELNCRIFHPNLSNNLKAKVDEWRSSGNFICFTQGCYDMLHPNHYFKLVAARRAVCRVCAERRGISIESADDSVRMLLSLDGDLGIRSNKNKSFADRRPVDSWTMRAFRVLTLREIDRSARAPLIDAVTIHDSVEFKRSFYESPLAIRNEIGCLDLWLISSENQELLNSASTIENPLNIASTPRFDGLSKLICGEDLSTSDLLERLIENL